MSNLLIINDFTELFIINDFNELLIIEEFETKKSEQFVLNRVTSKSIDRCVNYQ